MTIHYDPADVRLFIDGVEVPGDGIAAIATEQWSNGSVTVSAMVVDPAAWDEMLASLTALRHPTRIEAPSEVIAQLERQLPAVEQRDPFDPLHMLPIERDDELPMRSVRVHYSDGTSELVKLETIPAE